MNLGAILQGLFAGNAATNLGNVLAQLLCVIGQLVEFILLTVAILVAGLVGLPTDKLIAARDQIATFNCFA